MEKTILTIAQHYYRGGYNVMGLVRYRAETLKNGKTIWKKAELLYDVAPRSGMSAKFIAECKAAAALYDEPFRLKIRHGMPVAD
jgi:hypothetical protein